MILYRLRKDNFSNPDIGTYSSYGIDAVDEISDAPVRSIMDISIEKEPLENLVSLCNKLQLDLLQLDDAIQDFLP